MARMEILLGFVVMAGILGIAVAYLAAQACCVIRWRGGWRLAAGLPLLGWAVWGGLFARDVTADPTSHNLFPFEIMIAVTAALVYLGVLAVARHMLARRSSDPGRQS